MVRESSDLECMISDNCLGIAVGGEYEYNNWEPVRTRFTRGVI